MAIWRTGVLSAAFLLAVSGCGGGGGGSSPAGGSATTSTISVSGQVAVSSAGAGAAGVGVITKASLANASVTMASYDRTGTKLDNATVNTNQMGFYSVQLDLSSSGGYVVITSSKQGFTDYSKRIDYSSPADLNLNAELREVQTVVASVGTVMSAGVATPGFSFGVVRMADGSRKALAGMALQAAKAAGGAVTELSIDIPAASVPASTTTLVGNFSTFDSSDPNDARNFPGDYLDSSGRRLVSLAFDYVNITDTKGENLGDLVAAAKASGQLAKAASTPTIVSRAIPSGSAAGMLNDFCTDAKVSSSGAAADTTLCANLSDSQVLGFNVPVYTYNSATGEWVLLGMGTVDVNNDGNIDTSDLLADGNSNGSVVDEYQARVSNTAQTEYLQVVVTNEDFKNQWWNLDYPLVFQQPVQLCVAGKITDQSGSPIAGQHLTLSDDDGAQSFGYAYGMSDSSGNYRISTVLTDGTADRTAKVYYYDRYTYSYTSTTVTLGVSPNCGVGDITVQRPAFGKVTGKVLKNGQARANQLVWTWGASNGNYSSAYTDANGRFELQVRKDEDVNVYVSTGNSPAAVVNISGSTADYPTFEASDDNNVVVTRDLNLSNQAPYGWGWMKSSNIAATSGKTTLYLYGYDYDGDVPLTYSVTSTNNSWATKSGTLVAGAYLEVEVTNLPIGRYPLTLIVKDAAGASTSVDMGTLDAYDANRAPVISRAYADKYASPPGSVIKLTGAAYDLDGDAMSYSFSANGAIIAGDGCSGSQSNSFTATCSYTLPATASEMTIRFTVNDGRGGVSTRDFKVIAGTPGGLNIIIQ